MNNSRKVYLSALVTIGVIGAIVGATQISFWAQVSLAILTVLYGYLMGLSMIYKFKEKAGITNEIHSNL